MPDAAERFIAAATAPMASNPELQIAAERELRSHMEKAGPAACEDRASGNDAERLLENSAKRRPAVILIMAAVLVSLLIMGFTAYYFFSRRQAFEYWLSLGSFHYGELPPSLILPQASPEERIILFGDLARKGIAAQMQTLWERHPENAAYFREYALAHWKEHKTLPPDFLPVSERLSPGNAYFPVLAAAVMSHGCVESINPSKPGKANSGLLLEWVIKDPPKVDQALALLEQAASMPGWESYQDELLRERFAILPGVKDTSDRAILMYYLNNQRLTEPSVTNLTWLIAASAARCEREQDPTSLGRLLLIWKTVLPRVVDRETPTLFHCVVGESSLLLTANCLRQATVSLGLSKESVHLERQIDFLQRLAQKRKEDPRNGAFAAELSCQGSYLASMYEGVESFRPEGVSRPFAVSDLKPGRLSDYELASRAGSLIGCLIFAIAATCTSIYRFRGSLLARHLSLGISHLFRRRDWVWLLGLGVAAPFLTLEIIARLTPLGARDWNASTHGLTVTAGQLLATLALMLGMPVMVVRWRLGKRAPFLGFDNRRQWVAKPAMALCFLALLLFGIGFLSDNPAEYGGQTDLVELDVTEATGERWKPFLTATIAVCIGLVWWLFTGARALFSSRQEILRRVVISRLLVPAYVLAMLLMALAMPAYHAAEEYWLSHDRMMESTTETLPLARYDHDVAASYQKRLVEILTPSE